MASHAEVVDRLGQEINKLEAKLEKEADRRLQLNFKQRIAKIKDFLQNKLPIDQKASAEALKKDAIENATSGKDLKDIEVAHNMGPGEAAQEKYGGELIPPRSNPEETDDEYTETDDEYSFEEEEYANEQGGYGLLQNGWGSNSFQDIGNALNQAATWGGEQINAGGAAIGNALGGTVGNAVSAATSSFGDGEGLVNNLQQSGQNLQNVDYSGLNPFLNNGQGGGQGDGNTPPVDPTQEDGTNPVNVNSQWSSGVNNNSKNAGGGYKLMHDAYYGHGGRLPQHGYQALGGLAKIAGVGSNFMKSKDDGGVWGNSYTTPYLEAARTGVGMAIPVAGAISSAAKLGSKVTGGGEFWNPAGAQAKFLQRDPETGKRDWGGIAASLIAGPMGSFIHNTRKNGGHTRGGLAGLFINDERAEARWEKRQAKKEGKEDDEQGGYGLPQHGMFSPKPHMNNYKSAAMQESQRRSQNGVFDFMQKPGAKLALTAALSATGVGAPVAAVMNAGLKGLDYYTDRGPLRKDRRADRRERRAAFKRGDITRAEMRADRKADRKGRKEGNWDEVNSWEQPNQFMYGHGGNLSQHQYDGAPDGTTSQYDQYGNEYFVAPGEVLDQESSPASNIDWDNYINQFANVGDQVGGMSQGYTDMIDETGPMYHNQELLNSPREYIWNTQYNPMNNQYMQDLNESDIMVDDMTSLAYNPDQMDVNPYLRDIDNAHEDYLKNQVTYDDAAMASQSALDAYGTKLDTKAQTRDDVFQKNLILGGRDAQMNALAMANAQKSNIRDSALKIGANILNRDDMAYTHNLLTGEAGNKVAAQLSMDNSEYAQNKRYQEYLENSLSNSGQFYDFDPNQGGLTWKEYQEQAGYGNKNWNWDDF